MTKKEIILKPIVDANDVMVYCECGKTKAYRIMTTCRLKFQGNFEHDKQYITTDSLMNYFGTTRERELKILLLGGENEELQKDKI